ncbi:MAG: methyl-accepting chemotaxis protein [Phycisphaerae bacterium]
MAAFSRLSMRAKLFFVLGLLSVAAVAVAYIGITRLAGMNERLKGIADVSAEKVRLGGRINQDVLAITRAEKSMILATTQEEMDQYATSIDETRKKMQDRRERFRKLADPDGRRMLEAFEKNWEEYLSVNEQVRKLARLNSNVRARQLSIGEGRDAFDAFQKSLQAINTRNETEFDRIVSNSDDQVVKELGRYGTKVKVSANLLRTAVEYQRAEKNLILATDPAEMDELVQAMGALETEIQAKFEELSAMATEQERAVLAEAREAYRRYDQVNERVRNLSRENGNTRAFELAATRGKDLSEECIRTMAEIVADNEKDMDADKKLSEQNYAAARLMMLSVSITGILVSLTLGGLIIQRIIKTLRKLMADLAAGSTQVTEASSLVSQAGQVLSEGAAEQAASIEETSASVEEMTSMTKQTAGNAGEAKNLADAATHNADQGTEAMRKMSGAIDDIKRSSDETAKIIKTIDDIAFQTNLLALNAAVEAARAGEAGKGFAVVAEEVRNLAQRSAEAARNTADMIEKSVHNSEAGVAMTQEVTAAFEAINEGVRKVNSLVTEISTASGEQSQGIDQINVAVSELDTVTQRNAASAEESAAAAEELNSQAEELNQMVTQLGVLVEGAGNATDRELAFRPQPTGGSKAGSHSSPGTAVKPAASGKPEPVQNFQPSEDESRQMAKF